MTLKGWCFIGDSSLPENRDSKSTTYATHPKPKTNIWEQ